MLCLLMCTITISAASSTKSAKENATVIVGKQSKVSFAQMLGAEAIGSDKKRLKKHTDY
jgi:hypothetical protein